MDNLFIALAVFIFSDVFYGLTLDIWIHELLTQGFIREWEKICKRLNL